MSAIDTVRRSISLDRSAAARHKPDSFAFALWVAAVLVAAMALPAADWTDHLWMIPMLSVAGLFLGLLLVVSRLSGRAAFVLALGYGLILVLWEMTATLDPGMAWRDRALNILSRAASYGLRLLIGEPVDDPRLFLLLTSLLFWGIAVFGTWWLFRRRGLWLAVFLPGLAVFLNVYFYRFGARLEFYLPIFLLAILALIARMEPTGRRQDWERLHAQTSPDVASRMTRAGIAAAVLLVGLAWLVTHPPDLQIPSGSTLSPSLDKFFSDAFAALRSPVSVRGEMFGRSLALGAGRDPGSGDVFHAAADGTLPEGARPYWRGRSFDTYEDGQWSTTAGETATYLPEQGEVIEVSNLGRVLIDFTISPVLPSMNLLYLPAEWSRMDRAADIRQVEQGGDVVDLLDAVSAEGLVPGDSYRVRSRIAAPTAEELRAAGTDYPDWVRQVDLQLPAGFPAAVEDLALAITADASTPYDKAQAITDWLRSNMRYQREIDAPPAGAEPIAWFLFDSRAGFCDYYASSEVLMLRAVGVPARLAAGFAAGAYDADANEYSVALSDGHSWPEVYFPRYGWVEFEPTASQPALARSSAVVAAANPGTGEQDTLQRGPQAGAPAGGDAWDFSLRTEAGDLENQPSASEPMRFWYALLLTGATAALLTVATVRRVVAGVVLTATRVIGLKAPSLIRGWATPPGTEATVAFRRLAPWPSRLGSPPRVDATPHERGEAIAGALPEERENIETIIVTYNLERYGGRVPEPGRASRAWRALRPHLYRARLRKLLSALALPRAW